MHILDSALRNRRHLHRMRKDFEQSSNSSWLQGTKDPPSCRNVLTLIFASVSGCCNGASGRPINTRYTTPPPSLFSLPSSNARLDSTDLKRSKPKLKLLRNLSKNTTTSQNVYVVFPFRSQCISSSGVNGGVSFSSLPGKSVQGYCTNDNTRPRRLIETSMMLTLDLTAHGCSCGDSCQCPAGQCNCPVSYTPVLLPVTYCRTCRPANKCRTTEELKIPNMCC